MSASILENNKHEKKFHFFISYHHSSSSIVLKIVNRLIYEHNLKLWIDYKETNKGKPTAEEIETGLRESACALCFINQLYCESKWCRAELSFIFENNIFFIPIMLEQLPKDVDLNGVGLLTAGINKLYAYKESMQFEPWSEKLYDQLVHEIYKAISNIKMRTIT